MKYLHPFEPTGILLKISEELKEISFILEDEELITNFRRGNKSQGRYSFEPDAYYWISRVDPDRREEILSSDYYEEFIDRATQICNSHGYRITAGGNKYSHSDIVHLIDKISK